MARIIKKQFILTIKVDADNISKKYPNYNINWSSPKSFIKSTIKNIQMEGETNMSKRGMKEWGYSINIKEIK